MEQGNQYVHGRQGATGVPRLSLMQHSNSFPAHLPRNHPQWLSIHNDILPKHPIYTKPVLVSTHKLEIAPVTADPVSSFSAAPEAASEGRSLFVPSEAGTKPKS